MATQIHSQQQLHFIFLPFLAQGHQIPMADMARLFAERGITVTLVTTPLNFLRLKSFYETSKQLSLHLNIIQLKFPCLEVNLPEGCENMDAVPSRSLYKNFFEALALLQQPFENLLQELKPNCFFADKHFPWVGKTAAKLEIPWIMFDGMSCFSLLCTHLLRTSKVYENVSESEYFEVPDLPDRIRFSKDQLPSEFNSEEFKEIHDQMKVGEAWAYAVVVNSFDEMESNYIKVYQNSRRTKVWYIGPVMFVNKFEQEMAQRGNSLSINASQTIQWLDSWNPNSVVYASLGSIAKLPFSQMKELGLGLEETNKPFIWVIREDKTGDLERWIEEDGLEDRVKHRGLIIRSWAPQALILSHPSIGGFLTHCGWNSTIEGISCGVPLITWPMFSDQFYNNKLIVEVLRIGEKIAGVDRAILSGDEEKSAVVMKKEQVREAVETVVSNEYEAQERQKRSRKLSEIAMKATQDGGSSFTNIGLFIEDIKQRTNPKINPEDHG